MIKILKTIFHIFVLFLIVISLWPGSLFGILLYGNPNLQPNLAFNPFFTPVPGHLYAIASLFNHFIIYFFISMFGLCLYLRNRNFQKLAYGLFFLSIFLEVLQFMVPKRAFEILDLSANFAGVLLAYFVIKIYLSFNKP
jgi:VanZ family protein